MSKKYIMRIDLSVLNHLGINLYSNYAAVLSEAIANSWDADASKVSIKIDTNNDKLVIQDDGNGMDTNELNTKYLRVGYSKRVEEGDTSSLKNRPLMGRKGIGKLSLFSVANTISIHSKKANADAVAICMKKEDIESCAKEGKDYSPEEINATFDESKGTKIILTNLNIKRVSTTISSLKKRIARRFSVVGTTEFKVTINGEEINQSDREDLASLEYIWTFGNYICSNNDIQELKLDDVINEEDYLNHIDGWIGTSYKPSSLSRDDSFNLNSVVVLARGRLIQEDILQAINDGRVFTKYLTGTIYADFIDKSSDDDIATSDRQRIVEDDERYKELVKRIRASLNYIGNKWTELRKSKGITQTIKEIPAIREWLDSFSGDTKKHAEDVIGIVNTLTFDDDNKKREILRYSILAFERLRLRDELSELPKIIGQNSIDALLKAFGRIDDIEATLYHEITKGRISVINKLLNLTDINVKEKVLQEHLFEHLWLVDPSWERNTQITPVMEKNIRSIFKNINEGLTDDEKKGRIDLQFRKASGDYVIIELKRFSVKPNIYELIQQGEKYIGGAQKHLDSINDKSPILMIYVLGRFPDNPEKDKILKLLDVSHAKIITYDELIHNAQKAYSEYIDKNHKIDTINNIVSKI